MPVVGSTVASNKLPLLLLSAGELSPSLMSNSPLGWRSGASQTADTAASVGSNCARTARICIVDRQCRVNTLAMKQALRVRCSSDREVSWPVAPAEDQVLTASAISRIILINSVKLRDHRLFLANEEHSGMDASSMASASPRVTGRWYLCGARQARVGVKGGGRTGGGATDAAQQDGVG